jgi:acyl-CoA thioester hydrolase
MLTEHEIEIRVRYCETDAMGFLHHANHFTYFEMGRTEMLRAQGGNYRAVEESGLYLVVVKLECRYHASAHYDDLLRLVTKVERVSPAKIEHSYRLYRGEQLLTTANSVLACVDREGKVQRIPDVIAEHRPEGSARVIPRSE